MVAKKKKKTTKKGTVNKKAQSKKKATNKKIPKKVVKKKANGKTTHRVKNIAVWFDIPVENLDRAISFYSKVLGVKITRMEGAPKKYAMFPFIPGSASGGLVEDKSLVGERGPLLYLAGGKDLSVPLSRVEAAGGKILQEKMSIGPHGFMGIFRDSEGNRIALHSMK